MADSSPVSPVSPLNSPGPVPLRAPPLPPVGPPPARLARSFSFEDDQNQLNDGQSPQHFASKESGDISMLGNGRLQDAPRSPVRVNVRNADVVYRPSSAKIESLGMAQYDEYDPYSSRNMSDVRLERSPHRNTSTQTCDQDRHQSQSAILEGEDEHAIPGENFNHGISLQGHDTNRSHDSSPVVVAQLQYYHQASSSESNSRNASLGPIINRHLTPAATTTRRSMIQRPASAYSNPSDYIRGRSPAGIPRYAQQRGRSSGKSPDSRPLSYVDLLTTSYAQQHAPQPLALDNSNLRTAVGSSASLLTSHKTLQLYRMNVKKTTDSSSQYAFAQLLIDVANEQNGAKPAITSSRKKGGSPKSKVKTAEGRDSPYTDDDEPPTPAELMYEAKVILQRLADRSYPFAQYLLADGYASGVFNNGKPDDDRAFPLFIAASKHGHAESGFRAAICYEYGLGTRKDAAKAVQFLRLSASKNHPGAMTRLGTACIRHELGLNRYREGIKWLKRASESADHQYNVAPYMLGDMFVNGFGDDIFKDEVYAAQLFTTAAGLGNVEAAYRLGDAYEHGRISCPRDPALSVHFYTAAAQRGHAAAMMALCAWYMVGVPSVLDKDENEAFEWARKAAVLGLPKAQYATGYFSESGIGCRRDMLEANLWYVKAAEAGDLRAKHRLTAIGLATEGADPYQIARVEAIGNQKPKKKSGEKDKTSKKRTEVAGGDYGLGPDPTTQPAQQGTGIAMAGKTIRTQYPVTVPDDAEGGECSNGLETRVLIDEAGNANVDGKDEKISKDNKEKECIVM